MAELTQLATPPAGLALAEQKPANLEPTAKQVHVTPKAVEKIRSAFAREGVKGGLRLGVLGGGCSGLSYQFKFAPEPRPKDHVFEFEDVKVFVDPKSMLFLEGMTLDWQDSLHPIRIRFSEPACNEELRVRHILFGLASVLDKRGRLRTHASLPENHMAKNYFDFFGLNRNLTIDTNGLQKRFYELSRQWHPDRFSRKSAEEQAQALEATATLNDGYRILRDPVKRAEYLLTEEGFPVGEQRSKDVPAELLEEVFELNMMLEELRSGDDSARPQLEKARQSFLELKGGVDRDLEGLFAKYDASEAQSETAKQALHEIRGLLNRRRYIENLFGMWSARSIRRR